MDELLEALKQGDQENIDKLASNLLLTHDNQVNRVEANKFERYAPCRIHDYSSTKISPLGYITYRGNTYSFG